MPRAINRCPNCRSPVSPFAAGCAICGADLEAARARLAGRKRVNVFSLRWVGPRPGVDWLNLAVAVLLALAVAPLGFVLALYWALQRYHRGETLMSMLMLAAAVLAVAALLAPVWFWSHLYGGL